MAQTPTLEEVEAEMRRRGLLTVSGSVMDEPGTTLKEFQNFGESLFKGGTKGVVDILGGWGNLYDYLKKSNDPSAFSCANSHCSGVVVTHACTSSSSSSNQSRCIL